MNTRDSALAPSSLSSNPLPCPYSRTRPTLERDYLHLSHTQDPSVSHPLATHPTPPSMSSLQPPSLPAWDFDDLLSGSEPEVDFSRQPYELQQQSVRKPSSKRTTSTDNAAGGGGGGVSPLPAGPIPQGPNRPRSAGRADSSTAPFFPHEGEALMQRSSSTLQQQPPHQPSQQQQAFQPAPSSSPIKASRARSSSGTGLNRSQTLLSHSASPYRSSQELSRLLAKSPSSRKLGGGADGRAEDDARLEAGRRKARVTLE